MYNMPTQVGNSLFLAKSAVISCYSDNSAIFNITSEHNTGKQTVNFLGNPTNRINVDFSRANLKMDANTTTTFESDSSLNITGAATTFSTGTLAVSNAATTFSTGTLAVSNATTTFTDGTLGFTSVDITADLNSVVNVLRDPVDGNNVVNLRYLNNTLSDLKGTTTNTTVGDLENTSSSLFKAVNYLYEQFYQNSLTGENIDIFNLPCETTAAFSSDDITRFALLDNGYVVTPASSTT